MNAPDSLLERLLSALSLAKIGPEDRILIAFSGGLDSTVLTELFHRARPFGGPAPELLHVDHGLRPSSREDALFCRRFAELRALPFHLETLSFPDGAPRNQNAFRRRRLAALGKCALQRGVSFIALAHHGDDQIERFLLTARRGAGVRGLAMMPPTAPFPLAKIPVSLFRPLLNTRKEELRTFALQEGLSWVDDPSNQKGQYRRNRLRHNVLPALLENSADADGILRTIANIASEAKALDFYARQLASRAALPFPGLQAKAFLRDPLLGAPRAIRAHLLLSIAPWLTEEALSRVSEILENNPSGLTRFPAPGLLFTFDEHRMILEPSSERGGRDLLRRVVQPLSVEPLDEGSAPFFLSRFHWKTLSSPVPIPSDALEPPEIHFPLSSLSLPLSISAPPSGHRLGEIFRSHHIPQSYRPRWPTLIDAEGTPLWLPGLHRFESAPRASPSGPILSLSWEPGSELTEILHK